MKELENYEVDQVSGGSLAEWFPWLDERNYYRLYGF